VQPHTPPTEKVPPEQISHDAAEDELTLPAAHEMQSADPSACANLPQLQSVHWLVIAWL